MAAVTEDVRQKILENNNRIITDMKMGKPLGAVDMWQSWYPPRQIFDKSPDALDFGLVTKEKVPKLSLVSE